MIEIKEIRIGNYVNDYLGNTVKVTDIYKGLIYHTENKIGVTHGNILEPIPLTEDILLKCGFEYQDDLGIFFKGLFEIQKLRLGIDLRERFEAMLYDFNPSLDYLHQLQNLYFALTNEELIISL
jgi:hypothetical protein